jgi:hypothetical protein
MKTEDCLSCKSVQRIDDRILIDLYYPPYEDETDNDNAKYVEIDLMAVRGAMPLRISFNYSLNQWIIQQSNGGRADLGSSWEVQARIDANMDKVKYD